MKVVIYKGKLDEIIKQMKEDVDHEKDMASNKK